MPGAGETEMKSLDRRLLRLEILNYDDCSFENPEVLARAVAAINAIDTGPPGPLCTVSQDELMAEYHLWMEDFHSR